MINVNNFVEELTKSSMGKFIYDQDDVLAVLLVGSQLDQKIVDEDSDIDILCLTKGREEKSLFVLKYKGIIVHGDYVPITDFFTLQSADVIHMQKGRHIGLSYGYIRKPRFIGLHPDYQGFKDFLGEKASIISTINSYILMEEIGPLKYPLDQNGQPISSKKSACLLYLSYARQHEQPNYSLILKCKRGKHLIESQDYYEFKNHIFGLHNYMRTHPFNIARVNLEIGDEFIQKQMEVEGIHENKPSF